MIPREIARRASPSVRFAEPMPAPQSTWLAVEPKSCRFEASGKPLTSDGSWEAGPALLFDGHLFVAKRRHRLRADVFRTRLFFRETICLGGAEGARLFDKHACFLADDARRPRQAMFTGLMTTESVAKLACLSGEEWRHSLLRWESRADAFPLLPQLSRLLLRAVCRWAGVPLPEAEQRSRSAQFAAMIGGAEGIGPRRWHGTLSRLRLNRWMAGIVRGVREGAVQTPPGSALAVVATYRESDGKLLDPETAGDELLTFFRPFLAVDRYLIFCAHALHEHPRCRKRLISGDPLYAEWFMREVRRFYPLRSFALARVRETFTWRDYDFPAGARILFDFYGNDHDESLWPEPEIFNPERFAATCSKLSDFNSQATGGAHGVHPCASDQAVVTLMKTGAHFLTQRMDYEVPPQDLRINLRRMPTQPADRFIVRQIRRRHACAGYVKK